MMTNLMIMLEKTQHLVNVLWKIHQQAIPKTSIKMIQEPEKAIEQAKEKQSLISMRRYG